VVFGGGVGVITGVRQRPGGEKVARAGLRGRVTAHRRGRWLSFSKARNLSRRLGLTSEGQFIRWRRGLLKHPVKCPPDMPMHPDRVYSEFNGWPDFLNFTPITWLPFDQAREHVRQHKLRNQKEFRDWVTGRLSARGLPPKPNNIPANPDQIYSDQWKGYNDFLGTPKPSNLGRVWRPFKEAREFVRSLKLSSVEKFREWSKGSLKDKPPFPNDCCDGRNSSRNADHDIAQWRAALGPAIVNGSAA
jgi:hypothetical protein